MMTWPRLLSLLILYNVPSCLWGLSPPTPFSSSSSSSSSASPDTPSKTLLTASTVYLDVAVQNEPVGRLVFHLPNNPPPLPLHAENFIQLCKGSRRGIDPKAHYVGCEFDFSPTTIEEPLKGNGGRYRWAHSCKGRGRNAVGRTDQPLSDPASQLQSTHSCFGGQYYGIQYTEGDDDVDDDNDEDPGVMLTVPVVGPGYGSSKFSIVRVGESPPEWRERLLLNAGVIGRMDPTSLEVLHTMARQTSGPPTIVGAGVL